MNELFDVNRSVEYTLILEEDQLILRDTDLEMFRGRRPAVPRHYASNVNHWRICSNSPVLFTSTWHHRTVHWMNSSQPVWCSVVTMKHWWSPSWNTIQRVTSNRSSNWFAKEQQRRRQLFTLNSSDETKTNLKVRWRSRFLTRMNRLSRWAKFSSSIGKICKCLSHWYSHRTLSRIACEHGLISVYAH